MLQWVKSVLPKHKGLHLVPQPTGAKSWAWQPERGGEWRRVDPWSSLAISSSQLVTFSLGEECCFKN